jgi:hypothetical protein
MRIYKRCFLLGLSIGVSLCAHANVNPVDESLSVMHSEPLGGTLAVARNYHSRRTNVGIFGKGWCTMWESRLNKKADKFEFSYCGAGKTVSFSKAGGKWDTTDLGYHLTQVSNVNVVNLAGGDQFFFNADGKLQKTLIDGQETKAVYEAAQLVELQKGTEHFFFNYSADMKLVTGIKSSIGGTARYTYRKNQLSEVALANGPLYIYSYNSSGLLTNWNESGVKNSAEYKNGKVKSIAFGDCEETITSSGSGTRRTVSAKKECKGMPSETRMITIQGTDRTTGLEVKESGQGQEEGRSWRQGLLVEREKNREKVEYNYNSQGVIQELKAQGWSLHVDNRQGVKPSLLTFRRGKQDRAPARVRLEWQSGGLKTLDFSGDVVHYKESLNSISLTSKDFSLNLSDIPSGNKVWGKFKGQNIVPFEMGQPLAEISQTQANAASTIENYNKWKELVESL